MKKMEGQSFWLTFLTSIIPFVIIFILFFFLINQAQGGGGKVMNFGKSRARLYNEEKKRVTFEDVAGADEEKQELVEVVEFLKDPRKFAAVRRAHSERRACWSVRRVQVKRCWPARWPEKRACRSSRISGSDFVEMFVGVGASRVRDLFENAKKNSPCIIFIDEIDAVGRQRGAGLGGGHDEREQTLNQLLVEMDGFGANEGIIIIAATNRPDILDPALLRPGRFDRQITVDRPDVKGREAVLKVHARNKPLAKDVKLETIAKRTTGFTGADLENLLNEAALARGPPEQERYRDGRSGRSDRPRHRRYGEEEPGHQRAREADRRVSRSRTYDHRLFPGACGYGAQGDDYSARPGRRLCDHAAEGRPHAGDEAGTA